MDAPEIICERRGAAGCVTLNRPEALNALTHAMVDRLAAALDAWENDPAVTRVVVTGAGGRAFSAGGDIRRLHDQGRSGEIERSLAFWRDEYRLNIRIKRYPKPYVAIVDGMVMGGGVGVSLHGSHRVAGDGYRFAMPEVAIGFFPDIGATYALPRLPDRTGSYIALTGNRVGPGDAVALGLATHAVPSGALPALGRDLEGGAPVDEALAAHAAAPEPGPVSAERPLIARAFAAPSVPAILAALDREAEAGSAFARETAGTIRTRAPSSLAIAFEQMRRGPALGFEDAMATEFRIVNRVAAEPDFYEGVRATIIDRDGRPNWRPARIEDVDPAWVEAHFAPLPPGTELDGA